MIFQHIVLLLFSFLPFRPPVPLHTPPKAVVVSCPEGYSMVPGNAAYHTSDFCVMKYDASCTNPDPKCVTYEGVYDNALPGCAFRDQFHVVSAPNVPPLTFIPEDGTASDSAKRYCKNLGGHLLNNDEWMTVARSVEAVPANWCNPDGTGCGNPPGTMGKILVNGHNDSKPNKALPAGRDMEPNYLSDQKRTLELSNGQVMWDFAGNVWQWVDATIARKYEPHSRIPNLGGSGWVWAEFTTVPYDRTFDPSNPTWTSVQGVGRIYHYNLPGDTDSTLYTYIRGGNWRHGEDSGAFTIHMQPVPTKTGIDDVGFRCATSPG